MDYVYSNATAKIAVEASLENTIQIVRIIEQLISPQSIVANSIRHSETKRLRWKLHFRINSGNSNDRTSGGCLSTIAWRNVRRNLLVSYPPLYWTSNSFEVFCSLLVRIEPRILRARIIGFSLPWPTVNLVEQSFKTGLKLFYSTLKRTETKAPELLMHGCG